VTSKLLDAPQFSACYSNVLCVPKFVRRVVQVSHTIRAWFFLFICSVGGIRVETEKCGDIDVFFV